MSYELFQGHLVVISSSTYNQLRDVFSFLHIISICGELSFSCTARMVDNTIKEVYDDEDGWLSLCCEGVQVFDYILGEDFIYERECALNMCTLLLEDRDVFSSKGIAKIPVYALFLI